MANKDTNKKIHIDAINRDKVDPLYGFVYGEWFEVGSHHFRYENAEEPDKFYEQKVASSGSYKHVAYDKDDKEHKGELHAGEVRNYTQGGWSDQFDGHLDMNGELTGREEYGADHGLAVKGDSFKAVKGQKHDISDKGRSNGIAGKSLEHDMHHSSTTKSDYNKGDKWNYVEGHVANYNTKSNIQYTEEEDTRYTGGSYDRYVESKYHVYSKDAYVANTDSTFDTWSKQDMTMHTEAKGNFTANGDLLIKSDSKVTIQVGESIITIESSKITITSQEVEINGTPIKFNGGGTSSPPFQVS